jgi:hypothetical protein
MAGIELQLVKGSSRDFQLQAQDSAGNPATIFLDTDALATAVFSGEDEPVILSPASSWVDAPIGIYQVTFNDADTAGTPEGVYRIQTRAVRSGRSAVILDGTLLILTTTGSVTARPAYCTIADLRKLAPWIEDLQDDQADSEGFVEACADARDWLDELIIRNYRGGYIGLFGAHSQALAAWGWAGPRRALITNQFIKGFLDANTLLLTNPGGRKLVKASAYYALAQICMRQIGKGVKFGAYAAAFRQEADTLVVSSTAELDTNGDGIGEIPIVFSATNTLFT